MSPPDRPDLVPALADLLGLCRIDAGSRVAVLVRGEQRADYARAFEAAALSRGAATFTLRLPDVAPWPGRAPAGTGLDEIGPARTALAGVDLVVDLYRMMWSSAQRELLEAGVRVLACREPVEVLRRLFPTAERALRVERSARRLERARTLRITSSSGTDITYRIGGYRVLAQKGYCDEPGTWDHFASALVATCGDDDGVDGTLVLVPGDVLLPLGRYVSDEVRIEVAAGRVRDISGGADARLLSSYMASFGDEDAYGLSHVGWGLAETAQWEGLLTVPGSTGVENRSAYGTVMVSTGPNTEFGGSNHSRCHLDIPIHRSTLALDDEVVVADGELHLPDLAFPQEMG